MKIKKEKIIRNYELTFLIPTVYSQSEASKIKEEVLALIAKNKGKVIKDDEWGKKPLAYAIKKAGKAYSEAFYFHFVLEFQPEHVKKFEKSFLLEQRIVRHLLVLVENN